MHSCRRNQSSINARAAVRGSASYPNIRGVVSFVQTSSGVLVEADIYGLPYHHEKCAPNIFAFHIHEGSSCTGNRTDPFADAGEHYNPTKCPHPAHAGDMPPLFGNQGHALMKFLTDRFTTTEIIGRTVIIHSHLDDFTTQPSGGSGDRMACGKILRVS